MSDTTISMVMIARDEAESVDRCFSSFWDDVDEVVLVDTGSTDDTVARAKEFAESRGDSYTELIHDEGKRASSWGAKLVIAHFDWVDDFAAARTYADSFVTSQWRSWIDLDDEVRGMANLRRIAAGADPDLTMIYALYEYAINEHGSCFCELWRERLVRTSVGAQWLGRVHECQIGSGTMLRVPKDEACWIHRRDVVEVRDRNEKLLRAWVEEDPNDPRAVSYLAFELMGARIEQERDGKTISEPDREKLTESTQYFERYLGMPNQAPDVRAQTARRYAQVLMTQGRFTDAQAISAPMLVECPWWPDTLLTLGEIAHEQQDWRRTIDFAKQVLDRGQPDTMLIINPEDYSLRPRVLIASSLAASGDLEQAIKVGQEVTAVNPELMGIGGQLAGWAGALARDQAGQMWASSAQLLVRNDEPEKAIILLNTAPYFSNDHPAVIAARVQAANALMAPYVVEPVVDSPRAQFLARMLREQVAEPAEAGSEENPIVVEFEEAAA